MASRSSILSNGVSSPFAKATAANQILSDGVSSPYQKFVAGQAAKTFAGATAPTDQPQDQDFGGSTAPAGPSAAQTNPLLASLDSLGTILTNKNQGSQDEYGRAIDGYNAQDAIDKNVYGENTMNNEKSYTRNNQAALLNAANASTGLRGVLASLNALGGSGMDVVKKLVGRAANTDTGASRENFDANATSLNQSWSQAEQQQRQRRADADATLANNLQNNESSVLTSRQSIFQQLANLFGAGTAQGDQYASDATALAAPIAATTRATVAPYATASSSFSPTALQNYLGGTQNLDASKSGGSSTPINSPIYGAQKKDILSGVA